MDSMTDAERIYGWYQGLLQLTTEMHDRFKTEFDRIEREEEMWLASWKEQHHDTSPVA